MAPFYPPAFASLKERQVWPTALLGYFFLAQTMTENNSFPRFISCHCWADLTGKDKRQSVKQSGSALHHHSQKYSTLTMTISHPIMMSKSWLSQGRKPLGWEWEGLMNRVCLPQFSSELFWGGMGACLAVVRTCSWLCARDHYRGVRGAICGTRDRTGGQSCARLMYLALYDFSG